MAEQNQPTYSQEKINIPNPMDGQKPSSQPNTTIVHATHDWFAKQSFYKPRAGIEVTPLICGEEAFAAIHDAINTSKLSVDIIIWGFDPSMEFKPNTTGEKIGELLERKGKEGVRVKLLVWKNALTAPFEDTLPGDGSSGKGGSAKPATDHTKQLVQLDELKKENTVHGIWVI